MIAAGAGIFWQGNSTTYEFTSLRNEVVIIHGSGLYRYDLVSYAAQAIAQDVVTLVLGIPLLIAEYHLYSRGSLRGQLLLTGTLGYMLYTYTSYTFLSAYNEFFLLYVALFSLCLFAFILAMKGLDPEYIKQQISDKFPRRGIAIFMMVIAGFFDSGLAGAHRASIVRWYATHWVGILYNAGDPSPRPWDHRTRFRVDCHLIVERSTLGLCSFSRGTDQRSDNGRSPDCHDHRPNFGWRPSKPSRNNHVLWYRVGCVDFHADFVS